MKWIYATLNLESPITEKQLGEMGEAGWELAAATQLGWQPYRYIFKQPKKEDAE